MTTHIQKTEDSHRSHTLAHAAIISALVLSLFYYWFAVADRWAIFLYGHIAGGIFTEPAQPFDGVTSSRYWMAGLVAAGAVFVLYAIFNGVVGRIAARQRRPVIAPSWWRVWVLCLIPLGIGIPAITMTLNNPTLPAPLAAMCVAATVSGLAVALFLGSRANENPRALLWLLAEGIGIAPALLLFRVVELPGRGLSVPPATVWGVLVMGLIFGVFWLAGMRWLRKRRNRAAPTAGELLAAGVTLSYLLVPLLHYLLNGSGYRYISTAGNFFASNPLIQFAGLGVAALYAFIFANRRSPRPAVPAPHLPPS